MIRSVFNDPELKGIRIESDKYLIGGGSVANDLLASKELQAAFPNIEKHLLLEVPARYRTDDQVLHRLIRRG